ncbi:NAD(P)-binding domain-containing protein [Stieleria varia]|uniref:NAD(P)-binding domain-containing protein n=1 Tax=Stieleria varia TaxID=2528005 RepID=UPI001E5922CD|nr:NAD(P)-binding domain-containing protein [Stieleria varia]
MNDVLQQSESLPVLIVGAGPIGLELSVALHRCAIEHLVLDAGSIGQTMSWWAPGTRWFSSNERIAIAGVPLLTPDQGKATREQYLTYLRSVVAQFQLPVCTFESVIDVRPDAAGYVVTTRSTAGENTYRCGAVVLAIGGTDRPRRLGVPGEDLAHVDGYLREPHRYAGRRVVIVGGRNSAVEAALRLHHAGARVTLCHRGEELPEDGIKYWLLPEIKGLIAAERIRGCFGCVVTEITPSHVVAQSSQGERRLAADDVLTLIGYEQDKTLLQRIGIELTGENLRPQFDSETMETNLPRIYIAGTAVAGTQTSKYKTFLENCHDHVDKIVTHLTGAHGDHVESVKPYARQIVSQPES